MELTYFIRDISDCGGIQQTTVSVINELAVRGHVCRVISLYHKYERSFFGIDERVQCVSLFSHAVDTKKDFFKIRKKLNRAIRESRSDAYIVQGMGYAAFLSRANWKNKKIIVCEHAYFGFGQKFGLHGIGKHASLRKAAAIVTLTHLDRNEYGKHTQGVPVCCIYNPCDIPAGGNRYDPESRTIVSCGSLDRLKGFDKAIAAASKVLPGHPEWKWEIYGDGKERESLQEQIRTSGLEGRMILKGYEKDKEAIYGNKALFVMTSSFEGFGLVLVEAMAMGLPCAAFRVPYGPMELIRDGENGTLCEYNDIEALGKTIERLMEDGNLRKVMSENAGAFAARFGKAEITDEWERLFESVQDASCQ